MNELHKYKQTRFIDPELKHLGYAYYTIRKSIFNAVLKLKKEIKGNVCDLGCGIMPYKEFLLENKGITNYIGIDLYNSEYEEAVKPDLYWDGITIPLEDDSCDYVIATEFLEHYHSTEHILKEIHRVLKKDGCFFFTVPCVWEIHGKPFDEYRFTPFSLQKYFVKLNFTQIEIKPLGDINTSLIIIFGLWLENSHLSNLQQKIYRNLFKLYIDFC
ncbi:MAG: class I SAM-dependent methyltransferase [Crocinitomicaceae bacterium]